MTKRTQPKPKRTAPATPRITVRIDLDDQHRIGPGKIRLLEGIDEHGSIAAAGRALGMSYRRAWMLIENLNAMLAEPVVSASTGGSHGGGATVTPTGHDLIVRYRAIEAEVHRAAEHHLRGLTRQD